jgi:hypothetical protein
MAERQPRQNRLLPLRFFSSDCSNYGHRDHCCHGEWIRRICPDFGQENMREKLKTESLLPPE